MTGYTDPHVLVSTGWVEDHLNDDKVVMVEVDADRTKYDDGHIPGAVGWDWKQQLSDRYQRDILTPSHFESLMASSGIDNNTTVVLYGDYSNWFAAWAFWQMKVYGHRNVCLLDGGRDKWESEGRKLTTNSEPPPAAQYKTTSINQDLRAFLPQVRAAAKSRKAMLVDVRSPAEFTGVILAPAGVAETCQRGGHIPSAKNIEWSAVCGKDGTFRPQDELRDMYEAKGIVPEKEIITYCRIGERSSHSWFVLKHLLGYPDVKNYDGSWTEWGNLVGAPIEVGEERNLPRSRSSASPSAAAVGRRR